MLFKNLLKYFTPRYWAMKRLSRDLQAILDKHDIPSNGMGPYIEHNSGIYWSIVHYFDDIVIYPTGPLWEAKECFYTGTYPEELGQAPTIPLHPDNARYVMVQQLIKDGKLTPVGLTRLI